MTRPMFLVVLCTLITVALYLHLTLCEWHIPVLGQKFHGFMVLGVGEEVITQTRAVQFGWGVFARLNVSKAEAAFAGVAVPAMLLAASAVLWLKWRRDRAVERGGCRACGHLLDPADKTGRCPECGCVGVPRAVHRG